MGGKAVKQSDYYSAGMVLFAMCCNNDLNLMIKQKNGKNVNL